MSGVDPARPFCGATLASLAFPMRHAGEARVMGVEGMERGYIFGHVHHVARAGVEQPGAQRVPATR